MKDRKVLWDKPVGEMFLFNNEDTLAWEALRYETFGGIAY